MHVTLARRAWEYVIVSVYLEASERLSSRTPTRPRPTHHAPRTTHHSPRISPLLTRSTLHAAATALASRDPALARVLAAHGPPPLWARPQGFATLARIVLEQQVSLAAAATIYARVAQSLGGTFTPEAVARTGIDGLRALGLTRQKATYIAGLARHVTDGTLPLGRLSRLDDDAVHATLVSVPGIGPWTANIYLLMALRRPDVWPPGDLALVKALQSAYDLPRLPSREEAEAIAERWRPWRAVGARMLWHAYLAERRRAARRGGTTPRV